MTSLDVSDLPPTELPDEHLQALAQDWRRRALQGEALARGRAHKLEVEMRRRLASEFAAAAAPLRPAPTLGEVPDRWRRWRALAGWGRRSDSV